MLQVKTINGKNVTKQKEIVTVHYVLEYSTETYLENYGDENYKFMQEAFNTENKLDVLCRYVYSDRIDSVSSEYCVVYTQKQFYLINWESGDITKLDYKSINDVHKYVFSLMTERGTDWY